MPAEHTRSARDSDGRTGQLAQSDFLPTDLRFAVAAIAERFNACRLISFRDLNEELPARGLSSMEVEGVLQNLADHGIKVIEDDVAERLSR